jgi:hypothetical protein
VFHFSPVVRIRRQEPPSCPTSPKIETLLRLDTDRNFLMLIGAAIRNRPYVDRGARIACGVIE